MLRRYRSHFDFNSNLNLTTQCLAKRNQITLVPNPNKSSSGNCERLTKVQRVMLQRSYCFVNVISIVFGVGGHQQGSSPSFSYEDVWKSGANSSRLPVVTVSHHISACNTITEYRELNLT